MYYIYYRIPLGSPAFTTVMDVLRFPSLKSGEFHCCEFAGGGKVKVKRSGFKRVTIIKPAAVLTTPDRLQISKVDSLVPIVHPRSLQCEEGYLLRNYPSGEIESDYNYVAEILSSKVYELADETPIQLAHKLSDRLGVNIWLKREDLHPVCVLSFRNFFAVNLHFCSLKVLVFTSHELCYVNGTRKLQIMNLSNLNGL